MLTVHIENEWSHRLMAVYMYETTANGTRLYKVDQEGSLVTGPIYDEGETLPLEPTFRLTPEALKTLIEAAMEVAAPSPAIVNHLKDVIGVRDRLLTILEGKV